MDYNFFTYFFFLSLPGNTRKSAIYPFVDWQSAIRPFHGLVGPLFGTSWHKLAQVEQVQAPSWYRACAMAQGMASIVGIW